jgi:release factor glutamine methyltransferase
MPPFADLAPGVRVGAARRGLAQGLRAAGIEEPEADARLLLGHGLGLDHAGLVAAADRALSAEESAATAALATRRLAREPVARILGGKEFWGLALGLDATTLVPRPETETVVEAALAAIDGDRVRARVTRVADLGTGSGALLLALLSELPQARGIGTDASAGALAVARANARVLGLGPRTLFVRTDFGAALGGGFDLVVANPPYVRTGDIPGLAADVRDHDPHLALDGGADGLDAYRRIAAQAPQLLARDGILVLELGRGQAARVRDLLAAAGLATATIRDDLSGVARALVAHHALRSIAEG